MALLPLHYFFVFNDSMQPVSSFVPSENEGGIYEVLRVVDGIPLFLEDHLDRFYASAEIAGKIIRFSEIQIENLLNQLIEYNEVKTGNILISCKNNLKAFFIAHNYPTPEMIKNGVSCGILKAERENPNAKVFQTTVRQQANQLIEENGFYEVLLVDGEARITEGSRSNVFFVKDNFLFTPPAGEVLLGITRQKVLDLAIKNDLKYSEEDILLRDISSFDAVFLSGTSPKILPVNKIENFFYNTQNSVVTKLIESYESLIMRYISDKKNR
ncbi:aminotransferase class IV [Maribellus maritimus]|uniref:aminotransferase class IV n=1 Tax=Maribellus maritimus TaxID=2870838 RepID=UPI001EECA822|nr:aminotransferase class IV [Maribellus maritimus]MCG6186350.1 aminotransferase class IV [Maribellus maritimus]